MSQHIILCRDKQLSKLQEPEKKNLSQPKSFLSRQKITKALKKSCRDRVARLKNNCLSRQTSIEQGNESWVRIGLVS